MYMYIHYTSTRFLSFSVVLLITIIITRAVIKNRAVMMYNIRTVYQDIRGL